MPDIQPLTYLRAISDDRELTTAERMVAVMVMRHAGATGKRSHPGVRLLAAETGLSDKTVRTALKSLEAKKWLVLTYNGHGGDQAKSNEYDLNIPGRDSMHSPSGTGDRLGDPQSPIQEFPTGNPDSPTGNPGVPTGTGDLPDALRSDALHADAPITNAYRAKPQAQPSASPEAKPKVPPHDQTQPQGQDRPGPSPAAQPLDQPPGLEYIIGEVDRAGDTWTPNRNPIPPGRRRGDGSSRWETLRATQRPHTPPDYGNEVEESLGLTPEEYQMFRRDNGRVLLADIQHILDEVDPPRF